jgi:hypothetical protein
MRSPPTEVSQGKAPVDPAASNSTCADPMEIESRIVDQAALTDTVIVAAM